MESASVTIQLNHRWTRMHTDSRRAGGNGARLSQPQRSRTVWPQERYKPIWISTLLRMGQPRSVVLAPALASEEKPWKRPGFLQRFWHAASGERNSPTLYTG